MFAGIWIAWTGRSLKFTARIKLNLSWKLETHFYKLQLKAWEFRNKRQTGQYHVLALTLHLVWKVPIVPRWVSPIFCLLISLYIMPPRNLPSVLLIIIASIFCRQLPCFRDVKHVFSFYMRIQRFGVVHDKKSFLPYSLSRCCAISKHSLFHNLKPKLGEN